MAGKRSKRRKPTASLDEAVGLALFTSRDEAEQFMLDHPDGVMMSYLREYCEDNPAFAARLAARYGGKYVV